MVSKVEASLQFCSGLCCLAAMLSVQDSTTRCEFIWPKWRALRSIHIFLLLEAFRWKSVGNRVLDFDIESYLFPFSREEFLFTVSLGTKSLDDMRRPGWTCQKRQTHRWFPEDFCWIPDQVNDDTFLVNRVAKGLDTYPATGITIYSIYS